MTSRISGQTRLIALFGSPVSHSRSPVMQNTLFDAMGLDFAYVAFDIGLGRVAEAVAALRTLNLRGANVTTPLKRAVTAHLDRLSPAAELAGAVNVIVNDDGVLTGHTTDGEGFMMSLRDAGVDFAGRRMTLLGAGGAATAVAVQAATDGVGSIAIFNRRDAFFDEAVVLAARLRDRHDCDVRVHDLADLGALKAGIEASDILINATPLGMEASADRMALPDPDFLRPGLVVCDLIYVPRETLLLRHAARLGCRTVSGLGMQLFQAVPAFRLWTGRDMDVELARRTLFGPEPQPHGVGE